MTNWKDHGNPFLDFTEELTQQWIDKGFDREQTKEWLGVRIKANDTEFCVWLRDIKKTETIWVLNYGNIKQLESEFGEYLEVKKTLEKQEKELEEVVLSMKENKYCVCWLINWFRSQKLEKEVKLKREKIDLVEGCKISDGVIEQIKNFPLDERNLPKLNSDQELLVNKLISNKSLRERYKKYGLCLECNQPNTGYEYWSRTYWCQSCNGKHFQQDFKNWTSSNQIIDEFIQEQQLKSTNQRKVLEWIPYEQLTDIEYLAEGGFGKVYKAKWTGGGRINYWDIKNSKWKRWDEEEDYKIVALKSLNDSQNPSLDFLQEIANNKLVDYSNIVLCNGISQNPKTKDYMMVMGYIDGGSLRRHLQNNYDKLDLKDKLNQLSDIAKGLKDIHEQGLVHGDFHAGNILNKSYHHNYRSECFITDLGLCRPASEEKNSGTSYGVMPYVAPEILLRKPYTQASDIYSFGIVAYEIFYNTSPHFNSKYDFDLALSVCEGLRPNLEGDMKLPQLLKDLIKRCWDADPKKRLNSSELNKFLEDWCREITNEENTEFYLQYKTIEKDYNQISKNAAYREHSSEILTSRRLPFIENSTKLKDSLEISEQFCSPENMELSIDKLMEEFSIDEDEIAKQIEVPPKQNL